MKTHAKSFVHLLQCFHPRTDYRLFAIFRTNTQCSMHYHTHKLPLMCRVLCFYILNNLASMEVNCCSSNLISIIVVLCQLLIQQHLCNGCHLVSLKTYEIQSEHAGRIKQNQTTNRNQTADTNACLQSQAERHRVFGLKNPIQTQRCVFSCTRLTKLCFCLSETHDN